MARENLYKRILQEEGFGDWSAILKKQDGLCVHSRKELWVGNNEEIYLFLHELAHIKYKEHDANWGDYFTLLLYKYAPRDKLLTLLDGCSPVVEVFSAESEAQKTWKAKWLRDVKQHLNSL